MIAIVTGRAVVNCTSNCWPQPPRNVPGPPESVMRALRSISSGNKFSRVSTGVLEILLGKLIADLPSAPADAPMPPLRKNRPANLRSFPAAPVKFRHQRGDPLAAITRSGTASPRAPKRTSGRKCPMTARAPTETGNLALRIDPSGALTFIGRKLPSLFGTSGHRRHFSA